MRLFGGLMKERKRSKDLDRIIKEGAVESAKHQRDFWIQNLKEAKTTEERERCRRVIEECNNRIVKYGGIGEKRKYS